MQHDQLLNAFEIKKCMLVFEQPPSAIRTWLTEFMNQYWFYVTHFFSWVMLGCYYIVLYNPPHSESGGWVSYHLPPYLLALFPAFLLITIFIVGNLLDDYFLPVQVAGAISPFFLILACECGVILFRYNFAFFFQSWHHFAVATVLVSMPFLWLWVIYGFYKTWVHLYRRSKEDRDPTEKELAEIKRWEKEQMRKNMEYHKKVAARKAARAKQGNLSESNSGQKVQGDVHADWKPELRSFYETYVAPCARGMKNTGVFDAVIEILKLLDRYGDQSSITNDKEAKDYKNDPKGQARLEVFKKVTLLEHSINTVEAMIEDRKKKEPGYDKRMEIFLFCGLGHDLGKIGKLKAGHANFRKADHWFVSKQILEEIIPDAYNPKKDVLSAVGNHHYYVDQDDKLGLMLKEADQTARAKEMGKYASTAELLDGESGPDQLSVKASTDNKVQKHVLHEDVNLDWLDMDQLLEIIAQKINVFERYIHYAFMHKGIVYVEPCFVSSKIGELAEGNDTKIATFCNEEQMSRRIAFKFRTLMDEYVPDKIGPSYIGQRYQIILNSGEKLNPMRYIPIRIEAFPDEVEVEAKQRGQKNKIARSIANVKVAAKSAKW